MNEVYLALSVDLSAASSIRKIEFIGIFENLEEFKKSIRNKFGIPIREDFSDKNIISHKIRENFYYTGFTWKNGIEFVKYYKNEDEIVGTPVLTDKKYKFPFRSLYLKKCKINEL